MVSTSEFAGVCGTSGADASEGCMAGGFSMVAALGDGVARAVTSAVARAESVARAGPRAGRRRGPDDRLSLALLCVGSCTSLVLRFLASGRRDVGARGVPVGALTRCKGEVVAWSGTPEKSSEVVGADVAVSEGDGARSTLLPD